MLSMMSMLLVWFVLRFELHFDDFFLSQFAASSRPVGTAQRRHFHAINRVSCSKISYTYFSRRSDGCMLWSSLTTSSSFTCHGAVFLLSVLISYEVKMCRIWMIFTDRVIVIVLYCKYEQNGDLTVFIEAISHLT